MFEEVSDLDVLLSDVSSPTLDDLVHPTNEWTDQLNKKSVHDSNDVKGKGLLPAGEPQENGPIPAYRKRQHDAQVFYKNEEKKVHDSNNGKAKEMLLPEPDPKTSERKGTWTENEKGLFLSGLDRYGWGKWKNISSQIGTRSPEQVRSYSRRMRMRSTKQDIQSLPPDTNISFANPGHLPIFRTMMEPMSWASYVPPPIWRDLPLLRPEHGLYDIYGNYGDSVCPPSWNLMAEMGANPSSRISDQVWNSTNTLSSDSYGCLPGPSAYGNSMNPGQ